MYVRVYVHEATRQKVRQNKFRGIVADVAARFRGTDSLDHLVCANVAVAFMGAFISATWVVRRSGIVRGIDTIGGGGGSNHFPISS